MDIVLIAVIKEGNNVQQNCSAAQQIGLNVPLLSVSATCTDDIKTTSFWEVFLLIGWGKREAFWNLRLETSNLNNEKGDN